MKKFILLISFFSLISNILVSNGIIFNKEELNSYLTLVESSVLVSIESQVSTTIATQRFKNNSADSLRIKYAFPLPENASATKLRYKINNVWYTANFAPIPQDTNTGGDSGEVDYTLIEYLGNNPIYYDIAESINKDSTIIVQLTYVELLPYKFGKVNYSYPGDYSIIDPDCFINQELEFSLNSERTIDNITLLSHTANSLSNDGNHAIIKFSGSEIKANTNYLVQYSLSLDELGLYSLSIFLPDSLVKDSAGNGFFAFIVEPDPSENTDVIDKVFTLIIDRSGSMSGDKIIQARDAANFIVNNLNYGDKFNIISFAEDVTNYRTEHVEYNASNQASALAYINSLEATGSTNISGAFNSAIPQFFNSDINSANIIIFFTDGEQTAGITNTDELISHINQLIVQSEKQISLFTFGIGYSTNERLLTSIGNTNNGISEYLEDSELEEVITDFYLMIRNPVLLNTNITFSPEIISELYPGLLPNLYKGQQMILVGRYNNPEVLISKLSGTAFSEQVNYEYSISLSDSLDQNLQFLTKLWAKSKIEDLMDEYYMNINDYEYSDSIKNEVINVSMSYGVLSPFTSFQGSEVDIMDRANWSLSDEEISIPEWNNTGNLSNEYMDIVSLYPNPCTDIFNLIIDTKNNVNGILTITFINDEGKIVSYLQKHINRNQTYEYSFNTDELNLSSGTYMIMLQYDNQTLSIKVVVI